MSASKHPSAKCERMCVLNRISKCSTHVAPPWIRGPLIYICGPTFCLLELESNEYNIQVFQIVLIEASLLVFVVDADHKDKVLIKSNSVNLSNGCNQLPQCVLSSSANGCFTICCVDQYTHTLQEKWISSSPHPPAFSINMILITISMLQLMHTVLLYYGYSTFFLDQWFSTSFAPGPTITQEWQAMT